MPEATNLTLNYGVTLPALGPGVSPALSEDARDSVTAALATGYRHMDTAAAYTNEREVGEAMAAPDLDRSEVSIGTKSWISDYGFGQTRQP